jgi:hypothetical protein
MPFIHDHTTRTRMTLTAPHGGHPTHSLRRVTTDVAINQSGVPSVAKWIYLH